MHFKGVNLMPAFCVLFQAHTAWGSIGFLLTLGGGGDIFIQQNSHFHLPSAVLGEKAFSFTKPQSITGQRERHVTTVSNNSVIRGLVLTWLT